MREIKEYEDRVLENIELDLVQGKNKYHLIDKKRGIWVEGNHIKNFNIGYVGEGEDIVAENTRKMVSIYSRKEDYYSSFDIKFYVRTKKNSYDTVVINIYKDNLPIRFSKRFHEDSPFARFSAHDDNFYMEEGKNKTQIPINEFSVEKLVDKICDVVRRSNCSKEWKKEIESLLDITKPVLLICAIDAKNKWIDNLIDRSKRIKNIIDGKDQDIAELQEERLNYVKKYNYFKALAEALQQNNEDKLENSGENSDEYTPKKIK